MADDKKTDNDKRADDKRVADDKRADEKRADDKKAKAEPEDLTPTPTQAENDEFKAKVYGAEAEKKPEAKAKAKDAEDLTPTPTQAENDAAKLAAMYVPEGAGDPQKAESQTHHRRQVEANKPGVGYQTRAAEAVSAKAE